MWKQANQVNRKEDKGIQLIEKFILHKIHGQVSRDK